MFEAPHEPGALADAMAIFKRHKLNLTWIESFPIPGKRGLSGPRPVPVLRRVRRPPNRAHAPPRDRRRSSKKATQLDGAGLLSADGADRLPNQGSELQTSGGQASGVSVRMGVSGFAGTSVARAGKVSPQYCWPCEITESFVHSSLADEFALATYPILSVLSSGASLVLTSQMRRAAISVASNIVEGCRYDKPRGLPTLPVDWAGSAREVEYQASLAFSAWDSSTSKRTTEFIRTARRRMQPSSIRLNPLPQSDSPRGSAHDP